MPGVLAAALSKSIETVSQSRFCFPTSFLYLPRVLEGPLRALRSSIVAKMRLLRSTLVLLI